MPRHDNLVLQEVETRSQWREFFDLAEAINASDPAWVRPLRSMQQQLLDPASHPFYEHARRKAWLCYREGRAVGRIVAIKDDLHNEYHEDTVGFFGFLELIDDAEVLQLLTDAAEAWLTGQGCTSMRGPVCPSMKGEFGVLVDGNVFPPYVMTAHGPKCYDRLLTENGFSIAKQFYAYRIQPANEQSEHKIRFDRLAEAEQKIMRRYPQLKFRAVDRKNYAQTLRSINELGNVVRRHGWGFVPLTEAELQFMIRNLRRVIRFDMIHVAWWKDQLVGFIVNIPDINWVLSKTVGRSDLIRKLQMLFWIRRCPRSRVIAIGVHEEFRNKGIAIMLIKRLTDISDAFEEWELSWVAEDNLKSTRAIGSVIDLDRYKRWRMYEKEFSN